eukprot:scaffold32244_cov60-Attheya_sp.AAC.2
MGFVITHNIPDTLGVATLDPGPALSGFAQVHVDGWPIIIVIQQQSAERILENWDHIQRYYTFNHEHVLTGLACHIQSEAMSFTVSPTPAHCCVGMGGVYGRPRNKHIAMHTLSRMGKRPLIQYDECVTNMSVHEMSAEIGSASCLSWASFDRTNKLNVPS